MKVSSVILHTAMRTYVLSYLILNSTFQANSDKCSRDKILLLILHTLTAVGY